MKYAAKLLLFGEYTVIKGSQALAMPLPSYFGKWAFTTNKDQQQRLPQFAKHIESLNKNRQLPFYFDKDRLNSDLENGLFFDSNIPPGYGLGSSGALCAAIYDQYCTTKIERQEVHRYAELKQIFSLMESFFHGSSSGIDPLICYLNQLILLGPEGSIQIKKLPEKKQGVASFFLLDTGISRKTSPLVNIFLEKCKDKNYEHKILSQLLPEMNNSIAGFLEGEWDNLSDPLEMISSFQFQYFSEMIPDQLRDIWREGIQSKSFLLKLCGAGGGGAILGYTKKFDETQKLIEAFSLRQIFTPD